MITKPLSMYIHIKVKKTFKKKLYKQDFNIIENKNILNSLSFGMWPITIYILIINWDKFIFLFF